MMRLMRCKAYLALALLALTGCHSEKRPLDQPAMAIVPGYIRLDSGKLIQVIGFEKCPSSGYAWIGGSAGSKEKNCTVVGRDRTEFEISVGTNVGLVVERWRVTADERAIKLVRPDGDTATVFVAGK